MDVDAAGVGVLVAVFQPVQPEDPRHDGIAAGGVGPEDFTGPFAALEDGSERLAVANFFRDLQATQRRLVTALVVPDSEFRGGNRVGANQPPFLEKSEALFWNGYFNLVAAIPVVARFDGATAEKKCGEGS